MDFLFLIIIFIFGTIIGSFLNVVSLRFNTGKTVGGRSVCMSCGKKLVWYELFPVLSYIFLGGVCGKCKTKISFQYPLVETITGFLFVLVFIKILPISDLILGLITVTNLQLFWFIFYLIITSILIVISIYDIKHKIIPDLFVYTFITLSFISIFIGQNSWFIIPYFNSLIAGPLLALPFYLIWLISKGTWMGFGDAKLVLGIGWILGLGLGANAIILSFWIAAFVSILWLLITRHSIQPRTEIPFGPYLIIGMYIVLFYKIQVIDFGLIREIIFSLFS
jgi:leader peptidase (prepilin peptidase)/N-methyltransferase